MTLNPAVAFLLAALVLPIRAQQPAPDLILFHGNILTGAHLRSNDPSPTPARVSALAIAGGRVLATGSDAQILSLKSASTRLLDLQGAFALPGFNDAHTHLAQAGQQKLSIDLDRTPSLAAMLRTIQTYASRQKPDTWLQGGGWDHTLWPSKTLPTRQDLDRVTGRHPCILWRTDGHIAVANSAALAAAGIHAKTPDPAGAKIDRYPTGAPTGILRETAATNLIFSRIPPPTSEDRRRALDLAIADALAHGVTSVQDFSTWDDFLVLESMEHAGQLPLRVSEWLDFTLPLDVLKTRRASHPTDDPLLHTGMLKGFMDGSLGSRTAALAAPYADDPTNSGIPRFDQDRLNQMSAERAANGFQLGFHAIGDRANHIALEALSTSPTQTRRFRIEHAQVLLPQDFQRFHDRHIIASMQPSHLLTDMAWAEARLGPERAKYAYAWKSFLDHDVTIAFGTDYPVESIDPFRGLYAAVTRANEAGTQTFHPEEAITIQQALFAYTQASAFADFAETTRGRLEPGFVADLAILDRDPTTTSPRDLLHTRVLRTILNGETVYLAPDVAREIGSSTR